MNTDPRDLWATLPLDLRRQIVGEVAAVLAEICHEVRAGQADRLGDRTRLVRNRTLAEFVNIFRNLPLLLNMKF